MKLAARGYFKLLAFLSVKLICTACLVLYLVDRNHTVDHERLSTLESRLVSEVERRVLDYSHILTGTRTAIEVCPELNQATFGQIVEMSNLSEEFPAAVGVAYVQYVPDGQLETFIEQRRRDDRPNFAVWSVAGANPAEDLMVVSYAEPEATDLAVTGLDIGSEPSRREAAMLAARTGEVALSKPIELITPGSRATGFLMLVPCYTTATPPATEAERLASVKGWVGIKVMGDKIFDGAADSVGGELGFVVVDADQGTEKQPIFAASGELDADDLGATREHARVAMNIGGRPWSILIHKTQDFHAASLAGPWLAGCSGCFLSIIVAVIFVAQQRTANRAQQLAEQMTDQHRLQATTDRLTGLPNRNAITDRIQEAIHRSHRVSNYRFAILFIDFDRFKIVNDSMGHESGDRLLQSISARLRSVLRTNDISSRFSPSNRQYENFAARLGGDEFIILLDGIECDDDAQLVAKRLVDALRAPHDLGPVKVISTASVGVVLGHKDYTDAGELIRDADIAMYEAKSAGKNRAVVFTPEMRERVSEHMNIESDLRRALQGGQIRMVYQPIVSLETHRTTRFEALMRWEHPTRGPISPSEFIAVAEESDLIIDMDTFAIDQSARQLAQWRSMGVNIDAFHVSVNLSRRSIISQGLVDRVRKTLAKHAIEPSRLHLEVTERGFMLDPGGATVVLNQLRQLGVSIDLDDFGTGLSSLSCLDRLPIDTLKLDRAFVAGFVNDPKRVALVSALVHLSDHMGIDVVAEGVEDVEELMKLTQLGCGLGQGYFFSRPLEAAKVADFLQNGISAPRIAA